MDIFALITLIAASFTGATMGSFLFMSLLYNSLLKNKKNINDPLFIYRRLYRLNFALSLLAAICAALVNNRSASLMLVILAASFVFNHAHIIKGLMNSCDAQFNLVHHGQFQALSRIQNVMHLLQFAGAAYAIYLLSIF